MNGFDGLRVLVVDDDLAIIRLVTVILKSGGYFPLSAGGGAEGLDLLDELPPPDLIILDLRMPEIDDLTFYRRARLLGYTGPIIICSSHGAQAACRELGASAAIAKPFDPEELLSSIRSLLPSRL